MARKLYIATTSSAARAGKLPGTYTRITEDENTTRLIVVWPRDALGIGSIRIFWRFDSYDGMFTPNEGNREIDTPLADLVYLYRPGRNSPLRQGRYARWQWEAWTITTATTDVSVASVSADAALSAGLILGCAVTRNGRTVRFDGPRLDSVECLHVAN